MISNLSVKVNFIQNVIFLLLLPSPLNGANINSGQTESSQQVFPIDASNGVINQILNINDSDSAKINQILNSHNVSKDEILRRMAQPLSGTFPNSRQITTQQTFIKDETKETQNGEPFGSEAEKAQFLNIIKERLESIVERNSSRITAPDLSTTAINDIAFYPLCSKNNQTSWLEENTAKLYFSSSIFEYLRPNTFLHRAVLRLRQKVPESLTTTDASMSSEPDLQNGCSIVDDIIHVKVSIFVKHLHRGESKPVLKKLVCHSLTLNRINSEWVEIDVRQVIKYWEKMYRASLNHNKGSPVADPMVVIDVEDEYQQPLKAGLFFEPTDCQASSPIPWVIFGENIWSLSGTQILPFNPRLDIRWSRLDGRSHRSHRAHINRLENVRLLNESSAHTPIDYQYQASSVDQSNLNLVSTNSRNHRKRHAQQKRHNHGGSGYIYQSHRMRRSLQNNKRNHAKRKSITQVE